MSDQPNLLIDIWKKLGEISGQMGAVVAATTATGEKVDGLDDRLQKVEACVQKIPALEGRVTALEGKAQKNGGGGKQPVNWPAFVLSLVRWVLGAVVLGGALVLGYVYLVMPLLPTK